MIYLKKKPSDLPNRELRTAWRGLREKGKGRVNEEVRNGKMRCLNCDLKE